MNKHIINQFLYSMWHGNENIQGTLTLPEHLVPHPMQKRSVYNYSSTL